ncbi:hypothetical protein SLEP1_g42671 [Rubroshorea leprosula]|uniref:Uncharacterized protein n=1 Tax=Rubroshorea leprosula TaxID=152421 RepID=A0AAV5LB12_9ROSI|nr:hypothetical protein SLEP1_g42671 [Rubroshorea leprosula]
MPIRLCHVIDGEGVLVTEIPRIVNISPPQMRRAAIKLQVDGVYDGSKTRNLDLYLTQILKFGGELLGLRPGSREGFSLSIIF